MVKQYVNDALPAICERSRLYWDRSQLTSLQRTSSEGIFYTNLNLWNLYTENQINLWNRMEVDQDGNRWAEHYPFVI